MPGESQSENIANKSTKSEDTVMDQGNKSAVEKARDHKKKLEEKRRAEIYKLIPTLTQHQDLFNVIPGRSRALARCINSAAQPTNAYLSSAFFDMSEVAALVGNNPICKECHATDHEEEDCTFYSEIMTAVAKKIQMTPS